MSRKVKLLLAVTRVLLPLITIVGALTFLWLMFGMIGFLVSLIASAIAIGFVLSFDALYS